MKEEDKYYTPSIEEFHEGFEYEVKHEYRDEWSKDIWDVISNFGDTKLYNLDVEKCRVKYLDKEDIESCKWIFSNINTYGELVFKINKQSGINHFDFYELKILQHKIKITHRQEYGYDNSTHTLFYGFIKNKSEFEVLLKQLGI